MHALVVDDDDFTRFLLVRTLTTLGADSVDDAADAPTAMRLAQATSPDLATLDLDLGGGPNGIDLAHALRNARAVAAASRRRADAAAAAAVNRLRLFSTPDWSAVRDMNSR